MRFIGPLSSFLQGEGLLSTSCETSLDLGQPIRPMIEGLHLLPHNMLQHNVSSRLLNAIVQAVEKEDCIYMLNITVQAADKKKTAQAANKKRLHP